MKLVDFRTCYARLGLHPGTLGPEQASALFHLVGEADCDTLEVGATTGRTTVVLGTAAKNSGRSLYVASVSANGRGLDPVWMRRGVLGHGLAATVLVVGAWQREAVQLVVVSGPCDDPGAWIDAALAEGGRAVFLDGKLGREVAEKCGLEPEKGKGPLAVFKKVSKNAGLG